nr:MAG TPA: KacT, KacA, KacA, Complex, TOXIN [Caudoviricetes sp.]
MAGVKESTIQIRVGEEEKALLKALAEQNNTTLSEFVRSLCKKEILSVMNIKENPAATQNNQISEGEVDLAQKSITIPGGRDWVSYVYKTTPERKLKIEELAKQHNTSANIMIKNLLMNWLKNVQQYDNYSLPVQPRNRNEDNSAKISVSLIRQDREDILWNLKQLGYKLAALIDTLIDTYVKPQHNELKGE